MLSHDTSDQTPSTPADAAPRRRRLRAVLATVGAAALVTGGGVAVAAAHKTIELDVDGVEQTVSTFAGSVEGLLDEQDVAVGEHDAVGPELDSTLDDGMLVVVRSARQIRVDVDGEQRAMWTTAETTGEAIQSFGEAGRQITVAASRSRDGGREALDMPLVDGAPVEVVADGETRRVTPEDEAYLDDVLELAGVTVGKLDGVVVGTGEGGVVSVTVTRGTHALETDAEAIPFETTEREDDSLYVGERRVVQEGAEGRRVRASLAVQVNGEERVSEASNYVTVVAPVDEVVAVGTKERPVAPPPAAPSRGSSSGSSSSGGSSSGSSGSTGSGGGSSSSDESGSGGAPSSGVWASLAQCESGGNPSIVSSNGLYHGLYQFSVGTWQAVGGSGLPSEASAAEQTKRAQMLQARSGWGQWPACSAKLGLR
ncbi:transglycosylase family protein [Georgenia satyanarayanai]|uniref:transglycosylase family protein n=1 Tax=Georgenia satyanarayanai TaxID=860221 RepID=UPI00203E9ED2|nr:resuscitation-promoting factor [Georgenia satyanarayanai]MCM3662207.1 transglycosylase family protein [Georgenia satyanarayanai]